MKEFFTTKKKWFIFTTHGHKSSFQGEEDDTADVETVWSENLWPGSKEFFHFFLKRLYYLTKKSKPQREYRSPH